MTDTVEKTEDKHAHAKGNARAWMAEIVQMVDALEEAREGETECGQCEGMGEITGGLSSDGDGEECPVCDGTGTIDSEEDEDEITNRIAESPLSVSVRNGWYSPGDPTGSEPEEYEILLSTGGPALRIYGDLGNWSQPDDFPRLQWQDWFTPWTDFDITDEEREKLAQFARQFWFGE